MEMDKAAARVLVEIVRNLPVPRDATIVSRTCGDLDISDPNNMSSCQDPGSQTG
jgi:hypothetical protein